MPSINFLLYHELPFVWMIGLSFFSEAYFDVCFLVVNLLHVVGGGGGGEGSPVPTTPIIDLLKMSLLYGL